MVENHFAGMGDVAEGRKAVDALHPLVHVGEADDIAWGAVYLAFDEAKFVTGAKLVIDGGYTARWYQEFTPVKRAGTEGKTSGSATIVAGRLSPCPTSCTTLSGQSKKLAHVLPQLPLFIELQLFVAVKIAAGNYSNYFFTLQKGHMTKAAVPHQSQSVNCRHVRRHGRRPFGHDLPKRHVPVSTLCQHAAHGVAAGKNSHQFAMLINHQYGSCLPLPHMFTGIPNRRSMRKNQGVLVADDV